MLRSVDLYGECMCLPQLDSSLLSPQVICRLHWLPCGLHCPLPQYTSPGLHTAAEEPKTECAAWMVWWYKTTERRCIQSTAVSFFFHSYVLAVNKRVKLSGLSSGKLSSEIINLIFDLWSSWLDPVWKSFGQEWIAYNYNIPQLTRLQHCLQTDAAIHTTKNSWCKLVGAHLQHFASSRPSEQSFSPSHTFLRGIQRPSPQRNCLGHAAAQTHTRTHTLRLLTLNYMLW